MSWLTSHFYWKAVRSSSPFTPFSCQIGLSKNSEPRTRAFQSDISHNASLPLQFYFFMAHSTCIVLGLIQCVRTMVITRRIMGKVYGVYALPPWRITRWHYAIFQKPPYFFLSKHPFSFFILHAVTRLIIECTLYLSIITECNIEQPVKMFKYIWEFKHRKLKKVPDVAFMWRRF